MFNEFLAARHPTSRCSASRTTSPTSTASRVRRGPVVPCVADIQLPEGDLNDPPGMDTVSALGNRKNELFNHLLHTEGIAPYPGSLRLLNQLEADGKSYAVVSSSRNARPVLEAAGLAPRFAVVVDGVVAAQEHLNGKPAPDLFLHAARQLGVDKERAVVMEDAVSGVAAGRAGPFGLVVGVDRAGRGGAP